MKQDYFDDGELGDAEVVDCLPALPDKVANALIRRVEKAFSAVRAAQPKKPEESTDV